MEQETYGEGAVSSLTQAMRGYQEATDSFTWESLWDLFDGDRDKLNLAHECLDRHPGEATALRLQFADGRREEHSFAALSALSSRFASYLRAIGIERGDPVAIMLEPGLPFYACLFGAIKRGAIAVPLFTLFGPDGLALRIDDCRPRLLVCGVDQAALQEQFPDLPLFIADDGFEMAMAPFAPDYAPDTAADDLAVFQYTSGTTRALPEAVKHSHRAVVTLMVAALYGVGLRQGDRYFCPSSPAWGHGLWHGTIAPLALGIGVGAYAGKFDPARLLEALEAFEINNLAAAPTVFRMLRNSGLAGKYRIKLDKLGYTGEPLDTGTAEFIRQQWGVTPCSMFGTTEVGVILVNYPGFADFVPKPGALGKAAPGWQVAIIDDQDRELPAGEPGEIAVRRKGQWLRIKDRGWRDADGYFFHGGRSDDVIISAGWTMSAVEIEDSLLRHPAIREAAVIGVPDPLRGQVVKAFLVADRSGPGFEQELRQFMKDRLSQHEYPRRMAFVEELPRTPAGKINRRALRQREQDQAQAQQ